MTQSGSSPADILRLMLREGRRRVLGVAAIFAAIALAALLFGVMKPKEYESHAVILVESKNIITPLMEGRAVATGASDQASIVTGAMHSRRILREIMVFGGWGEQPDARAEERMLTKLSRRIQISRSRPELIKLSYVDTDPERAYAIAKKLAQIYIHEASFAKARQSSEAFDFIDRQVSEYAVKMAAAHAAVQGYSRAHGDPARKTPSKPPKRSDVAAARPTAPGPSAEDLAALRAEESVLAAQVASGELRQVQQSRDDRVAQLQRELDALLGTYTDKHPNVARVREELQIAQQESENSAARQELTARVVGARLQEVRNRIAAATGGEATPRGAAPQAVPPSQSAQNTAALGGLLGLRVAPMTLQETVLAQDSTLADLLRRYESTRDVYQDLLKRRENARVSMELDSEQRGLTVRMYEEPELPRLATGMRLMHFALFGLVLAGGVPLGLLVALVRLDPRVRSAQQIEREGLAPLLVTIPYAPTSQDTAREHRRILAAVALVAAVVATYAMVLVARSVDLREAVNGVRTLWS